MYIVFFVNFDLDKIFFYGNNKIYDEFEMVVEKGVKIVFDNFDEFEMLSLICKIKNKKVDVLI